MNTDKKIDTINGIDNVTIQTHTIIYKMLEWLEDEAEKRRPRQEVEETQGVLRVLKTFSSQKNKHVLGGSVQEGSLSVNQSAKLMRKDELVSYGKLVGLQQGKIEATVIHAGNECGLMLECNEEPLPGDMIITFIKTQK
ncbi:MAG: hypothetical protein LRY41_00760 [Candidatus Pacebacteria bacterium]|nr:hypothetical protein [Candidatus Paceibacterota bacterium]